MGATFHGRRSGAQRGALENNFGQRFSWAPLAISPKSSPTALLRLIGKLGFPNFTNYSKQSEREAPSTLGQHQLLAYVETRPTQKPHHYRLLET